MKKLTMIGNAHLDAVWLWNWQEGYQEVKATFQSALDRMNEDKDFIFTCSSTQYYEWVEENDSEMFEQIKKRVEEGRWELIGGYLIQPDCNLPSGESFARQALYGQKYFQEKFGKKVKVGYNVDSFGHNGNMPQLLKKSQMDYYIFMRPMPNEMGISRRLFNWESKDGSKVLAYRIPFEYNSASGSLEKFTDRYIQELETEEELMMFYGVGNHGGGPTKENIKSIKKLDKDTNYPAMKMGRVVDFMDNYKGNISYVTSDLQHHASGCYGANSEVKKLNRLSENRLVRAEKFSVISNYLTNKEYPKNYERAWKQVLFNQFHDILAGCSIKSAYDDARFSYGEALNIASQNQNNAIQSISWNIKIPTELEMVPVVIFNSNGFDDNVIVEFEARGHGYDDFVLTDMDNNEIAAQSIMSEATVMKNSQTRILVQTEIKTLGYKTFKLYKKRKYKSKFKNVKVKYDMLENDLIKYTFNKKTGMIESIYDKKNKLELMKKPSTLSLYKDPSDTWSHNIFKFDDYIGDMQLVDMKILEEGPVRSSIQVKYKYNDSFILMNYRLYSNEKQCEVKTKINWREPKVILKMRYPLNLNFRESTYEIPYSYIEKSGNGEEEAGQTWIDMTGEIKDRNSYGLSIINDAKYSYEMNVNEIVITLLKNSVFAHHDPRTLDDETYDYVDEGIQEFTYILNPHESTWKKSDTIKLAHRLNQPATVIIETFHDNGTFKVEDTFMSIDKSNIYLGALKQEEGGSNYILRLYEAIGKNTEVNISVFGVDIKATFKSTEIKTLSIDIENKTYKEVDFLEEEYEG